MDYVWKYRNMNPIAEKSYEMADIPKILSKVLYNRGYTADDYEIINDGIFEMTNYYRENIPCMEAAAKRINRALLDSNTQIYIFSDYDTDGITSAAIFHDIAFSLAKYDEHYNNNFVIHIPERIDGYGLNTDWCTKVIAEKNKPENQEKDFLVITFDNGITKNMQIDYLRKNNIEVIVTDHHEPGDKIPSGIVVDPKKDDEKVGEELCGAGISWIIAYRLYQLCLATFKNKEKEKDLTESLKRALEYAAIGTVGDMMPMTLFNLSLVKKGLACLNEKDKNNSPLVDLIEELKKNSKTMAFEITSKDIGFTIAAAINACGQMGYANKAMNLFLGNGTAESVRECLNISQNETKKAKTVIDKDLEQGRFDNDLICIYTMFDIPKGIAGKLSNHICSCTGKPAIVLASDKNSLTNEISGSARCSNPTIDILNLLKKLENDNIIKSAAGHKAACGVVFYKDKIEEAKNKLNEMIVENIEKNESEINPKADLYIDDTIEIKDIVYKNYKDINNMPYSMNFSAPNFLFKGYIEKVKISSSNKNNICYTIRDLIGNSTIDIWVWNKKAQEYKDNKPSKISIVGNLSRNFLKPGQITLDVVDLRFE